MVPMPTVTVLAIVRSEVKDQGHYGLQCLITKFALPDELMAVRFRNMVEILLHKLPHTEDLTKLKNQRLRSYGRCPSLGGV